jgi:hypothetical protein
MFGEGTSPVMTKMPYTAVSRIMLFVLPFATALVCIGIGRGDSVNLDV